MWYTHTKTHAEWLWCFTVNGEWRSSEWRTHTSMVRMSSIRKSIQKRCGPFSKLYTTHYIGTLISLSVSLCVCTFFVVVYRRHRIRQKRAKNQCSDIISLVVCTNRCNFQVTALVKFGSMRFGVRSSSPLGCCAFYCWSDKMVYTSNSKTHSVICNCNVNLVQRKIISLDPAALSPFEHSNPILLQECYM